MKIPKSIMLHGREFKIEYIPKVRKTKCGGGRINYKVAGLALYNQGKIILAKKDQSNNYFDKDMKNVIFLHELMHMVLDEMEYYDLAHNEAFVEELAQLMYQIIKQLEKQC